jgi:uncharacterized protein
MTDNPQDQPTEGGQQPGGQQPYSGQPTPPPPPPPPPPGQAPTYGLSAQAPVSPSDARMWSTLAHVGGIFFSFVPSLVIYLMYKDRDPFVRRHATQALNFQIIIAIAYFVAGLLTIALIGFLLLPAVGICMVVFSIIAAMAANKGAEYTYPMIPQMIT